MSKKIIGYCLAGLLLLVCAVVALADYPVFPKSAIATPAQCVAITASSVQYTLPSVSIYYYIKVKGNDVYLKEGSNPTVTATVVTGHGIALSDGDLWGPIRLTGPKVAVIGDTAAGEICFVPLYQTAL